MTLWRRRDEGKEKWRALGGQLGRLQEEEVVICDCGAPDCKRVAMRTGRKRWVKVKARPC